MSTKKLVLIFLSGFGFIVVIFLVYISLLGENNKIDIEIEKYLNTLKSQDYISAYNKIIGTSDQGESLKKGFNYDFGFVNFLALRDKFSCVETDDYKFEFKKQSFWLPYKNKSVVKVGLRLIRINDFNTVSLLFDKNKPDFIENYITIKRIKGIWRIIDINWEHPDLINNFRKIHGRLNSNKFIMNNKNSVSFKKFRIDYTKLKKIDIKIFKFQLNKVENMIDKPEFFTGIRK